MVKALFFDIDGTLVSFNTHEVPESTVRALEEVHEKGVFIIIATGRHRKKIDNLGQLEDRGLIDGYISMNGAFCFVGKEVLYRHPIRSKDVISMLSYGREFDITTVFTGEDEIMVVNPTGVFKDAYYKELNISPIGEASPEHVSGCRIYQMTSFLSPEMEKKVRINIPDCEFSRWNPAFVDINASGCTKSTGMDIMCKYFGISPAESVAFGDGGNDISIIKHAGTGIAMGQAGDNVKRSADYVTTSVDEDGISNALKKLVL